ncbi:MAG: DUF2058 domain-containing protein [Gammaproteobacteria bacterium]
MANAFQEQFLKLGLVDEKKINQTKHEKHKQTTQQRHSKQPPVDAAKRAAQQAQQAKAERDRLLNEERQAVAAKKAATAEIKQLVAENRQPKGNGDVPYNFTDGTKIRRLYMTEALRAQLMKGVMAIVKAGGQYEVVPIAIADKIRQRSAQCVILLSTEPTSGAPAADDPYGDYKVPDDLIW